MDDERLDDLLVDESMRLLQRTTAFSFSIDAILLGNFVNIPIQKGKILDLCTGNGVIPLLLSRRTKASIVGVEIQERIFSMAERNVVLNQLENRLKMIHGDLKEMKS